jgi:hypothetical protein
MLTQARAGFRRYGLCLHGMQLDLVLVGSKVMQILCLCNIDSFCVSATSILIFLGLGSLISIPLCIFSPHVLCEFIHISLYNTYIEMGLQ